MSTKKKTEEINPETTEEITIDVPEEELEEITIEEINPEIQESLNRLAQLDCTTHEFDIELRKYRKLVDREKTADMKLVQKATYYASKHKKKLAAASVAAGLAIGALIFASRKEEDPDDYDYDYEPQAIEAPDSTEE